MFSSSADQKDSHYRKVLEASPLNSKEKGKETLRAILKKDGLDSYAPMGGGQPWQRVLDWQSALSAKSYEMERLAHETMHDGFLHSAWWTSFLSLCVAKICVGKNDKAWTYYPTLEAWCMRCILDQAPMLKLLSFQINRFGIPCIEHPFEDENGTDKVRIQFLEERLLNYQFLDSKDEMVMSCIINVDEWFEMLEIAYA